MYTIKQAAARTGVSVPLLRAWQRRYGVVDPERSPAGYRLYSDDDLARIRAMRVLIAEGWSPSAAAASLEGVPPGTVASHASINHPDTVVVRFTEAAAAMNGEEVVRLLDEMSSLASFETMAETYLLPAMVSVGEAWERGDLDVAAEHAASHAVLRRLSTAFEAAGPAGGADRVLVGLPPAARHELGALAFSVAARRAGLPVTYLGADLPAADWVEAASRSGARSAVIAVPTDADRGNAAAVAEALRSTHPGLLLAAGGRGALDGLGPDVTVLPHSLRAAVEALQRVIGR
jgi:DNA-binding transcriptional MerR regulator